MDELIRHTLLEENFELGDLLASAATADLFAATWKGQQRSVWLWRQRVPLQFTSSAGKEFQRRMLHCIGLADLITFGVDKAGYAFTVLQPLVQVLSPDCFDTSKDAERGFFECVELISRLEERSVPCGDISLASFALDEEGRVRLTGVLGLSSLYAPPLKLSMVHEPAITFIAPEVRKGSPPNNLADVFSLGVVAERLLEPFMDVSHDSPERASSVSWMQQIIPKCLTADTTERFRSVNALLDSSIVEREARLYRESVAASAPQLEGADAQENVAHAASLDRMSRLQGRIVNRRSLVNKSLVVIGILVGISLPLIVRLSVHPPRPVAQVQPTPAPKKVAYTEMDDTKLRETFTTAVSEDWADLPQLLPM